MQPDYAAAHSNRGHTLQELRRFTRRWQAYESALALRPDLVNAHYGLALCCLVIGDFARGWQKHEWRWETDLSPTKRHFVKPLWLGAEDIAGKTILLHAEQGFGDTLQFCRYVPLVAELGARRRPGGADGFARADAHAALYGADSFLEAIRCPHLICIARCSACRSRSRRGLETIPAQIPYLSVPDDKRGAWRDRLGRHDRLRVGLVWAGDPRKHQSNANRGDRRRSIRLRSTRAGA